MIGHRFARRSVSWGGICFVVAILLVGGLVPSTSRASNLVTASTPPLTVSISISPQTPTQGSQFTISASTSGGVPPYTYVWNGAPQGCNPQPTANFQCSISGTGEYSIGVTVTDHNGTQASSSQNFNVASSGGNQGNGNGGSGSNGSNGFNLSSFGPLLVYGLIAGLVGFALLVALTVGVIMIAVILSRRLPRQPRGRLVCGSCQAHAPAGSKFCPACAAPLAATKQG
jgi:hypothetical protein